MIHSSNESIIPEPLRIVIADDEVDTRKVLSGLLSQLGHVVVGEAASGPELIEVCAHQQPDLVLTDIMMPEMDGIEAGEKIYRSRPVAIILISGYHENELLDRASLNHVMTFLVKPIRVENLVASISLAIRRFRELEAIREEAQGLRQALTDRKLIERAKGLLMTHAQLTEEDAFRRLKKQATTHNKRLAEIADMIITAMQAMQEEAKTTSRSRARSKTLRRARS